ncbi:RNA methyltransferase [Brevibacterium salitolerans]|uniref:RNA methyltransferase n=1 Tax=Brevibacterium salitolerans TaxID=1403566 RepID=A0ABN2X435_9MICO
MSATPESAPVHPLLTGPEVRNPLSSKLKEAGKLLRRTGRKRERRFLVEGPQAVREAVRRQGELRPVAATAGQHEEGREPRPAGAVLDVWATPEAAERHPDVVEAARGAGLRVRQATAEALAGLTDTVASQGILAVVEQLDVELADVLTRQARLVVVLSQVRDPGNAGTVLRVADAAGADAVVVTSSSVDVYNPKTVRSTAGSLFHVPVVTNVGLPEVAELARARGLQVLAADAHPPAHDLHVPWDTGLDLTRPTAWVFGNEAWGLPEADRAQCDSAVAVPLYGRAESLNLATAASICIYESAKHVRL